MHRVTVNRQSGDRRVALAVQLCHLLDMRAGRQVDPLVCEALELERARNGHARMRRWQGVQDEGHDADGTSDREPAAADSAAYGAHMSARAKRAPLTAVAARATARFNLDAGARYGRPSGEFWDDFGC